KTTPARRPSPGRREPNGSCSPDLSATCAWPTPSIYGPSPRLVRHRGLGPSTTTAEPPETPITQRCATSEIASSASCTVASFATPTTTRTLPGDTGQNSNWPEPLDKLGPWDI